MSVKFSFAHISDLHFAETPNERFILDAIKSKADRVRAICGNLPGWFRQRLSLRAINLAQEQLLDQGLLKTGWSVSFTSHDETVTKELLSHLEGIGYLDGLIFTGDIATTASRGNLEAAMSFFVPPYLGSRKLFGEHDLRLEATSNHRCFVMPGNHDRFSPWLKVPNSGLFEDVFRENWQAGQDHPSCSISCTNKAIKHFVLAEKAGPAQKESVVICLVDLAFGEQSLWGIAKRLPGNIFGRGYADAEVLSDLVTITKEIRATSNPPPLVIWGVHYPPCMHMTNPSLLLEEERRLVVAAKQAEVPIILSGHYHRSCTYPILSAPNTVQVITAGSATTYVPEPHNEFFEIHLDVKNGLLAAAPKIHLFRWVGTGHPTLASPDVRTNWVQVPACLPGEMKIIPC